MRTIDLRSDTVTHPSPAMRRAMAEAELGDDGWGDDPTVNRLQERVADLLGKEAAVFVPSGTMANLASVLAHCQRGEEIVLGDQSHIYLYEYGSVSALGGVAYRQLPNAEDGTLDPDMVEDAIRPVSPRFPRTGLVCLENTHNRCSGQALTREYTEAIAGIAHARGAALHLDGARIFNAAVCQDVPASELVKAADSLMFCFSKGLSCPVGSIVCGSHEFIARARRVRNSLGGGMRQVGVLAAAAMVALDEMVERLADDHANARRLAEGLARVPGILIDPAHIHTNIVIFEVADCDPVEFIRRLGEQGVLVSHTHGAKLRMVTHYGIEQQDIDDALNAVESVAMEARESPGVMGAKPGAGSPGLSPVRAGLTAGSAAAVCGSVLNLPLLSPTDTLMNSATVTAASLAGGVGAGLLWQALGRSRRRPAYFLGSNGACICIDGRRSRGRRDPAGAQRVLHGASGRAHHCRHRSLDAAPDDGRSCASGSRDGCVRAGSAGRLAPRWPEWATRKAAGWSCLPGLHRCRSTAPIRFDERLEYR